MMSFRRIRGRRNRRRGTTAADLDAETSQEQASQTSAPNNGRSDLQAEATALMANADYVRETYALAELMENLRGPQ